MVKPKPTAPRTLKLGAHKLMAASFLRLRVQFKLLAKIAGLGAGVNLLINLVSASGVGPVYQSFWFVFVSAAIIWTLRNGKGGKRSPSLAQAYWDGSAPSLKLIVIFSLLVLATTPFSIGGFVFGTVNYLALDSWAADLIAAAVWLLFGLVSLILCARLVLGLVIVTLPGINPGKAIKHSWSLSKGRVRSLARRLGVVLFYAGLILGLLAIGLTAAGVSGVWAQRLLELLIWGLVLPFVYSYIFTLYKQAI